MSDAEEKELSIPFLKLKYPKLILKFSAKWCGPCKDPKMLEKLYTVSNAHGYHVEEIDIDEYGELCTEYSVKAVPTFVLYDQNSESKTIVGGNIETMEQWITRNKISDD